MNAHLHRIRNWSELARESNWSAAALAKKCRVSLRTLERYFLRRMQVCPRCWLVQERQRTAIVLLREGFTVKETAANVGYEHASNFSRDFKKYWSHSPSADNPAGAQAGVLGHP